MDSNLYDALGTDDLALYRSLFNSREFIDDGLHLLNASVIPNGKDGQWTLQTVSPQLAYRLHFAAVGTGPMGEGLTAGLFSHIGHEGTAQAIGELHGSHVEVNRSPWDGRGIGLAMTLKTRQREGEILTKERLLEVGYVWRLIYFGAPTSADVAWPAPLGESERPSGRIVGDDDRKIFPHGSV